MLSVMVSLEFIPNEIRNSIYSLIPTLVAIMGIPLLPIVGLITEYFGLISGIFTTLLIALMSSLFILLSFRSVCLRFAGGGVSALFAGQLPDDAKIGSMTLQKGITLVILVVREKL